MSRSIIDFVERNIHGAWVVWGDLGIRQYYGYTKKESMKKYRQEWRETVAPFICQKVNWHEVYQIIGKHLFVAYPVYMENPQQIIIIADTLGQAENAAERHWPDRKLCVRQVRQLENVQIYD